MANDTTPCDGCGACDLADESTEPETWSLLDCSHSPWEWGGWMNAGFTSNAHGNRSGTGNDPLANNKVSDTPVMNQLWFYAEKAADTEAYGVDWGFRVDYLFGVDGPDQQTYGDQGWDFGWNTSRDYGSAIPQLYADLGVHDWTFRVGHAIAWQGYEANQAVDNFFYTYNYAFGYGTSATFTGAAIKYQYSDDLELAVGWSTGWDSWWSNYLSASTVISGFSWSIADESNLHFFNTIGDFGDGTAKNGASSNAGNIYAHSLVLEHQLSDRTTYVIENTLGSITGRGIDESQWYSITNNLFHDINDCWSAGLRIEWFRDDDGQQIGINGSGPGSFYEATLGLNWQPHPNLRLRPEVRWDWFDGVGRPFDSRDGVTGTEVKQFTGAMDVVVTF